MRGKVNCNREDVTLHVEEVFCLVRRGGLAKNKIAGMGVNSLYHGSKEMWGWHKEFLVGEGREREVLKRGLLSALGRLSNP